MEIQPQSDSASITPPPASDYDTPWKIALEQHFEAFMAFYFQEVHAQIDWKVPHEFLDKEFQAITKDALVGTRYVDKLVKVRRLSGDEDWLCIHVEVQTSQQARFAERMFVYHYRIFDLYGKPAVSLALLGDDAPNWQPKRYAYALMGCKLDFEFPIVKLLNYTAIEAELETNPNPFALLTLAYLKNRATAADMHQRYEVKCKLIRLLHAHNWDENMIRQFFLVIDWMMALPPELSVKLSTFIREFERENSMEYVSSIERVRSEQKFVEGAQVATLAMLRRLLASRFGDLPPAIQSLLAKASGAQLEEWFDRGLQAQTLDEVFQGVAQ